MAEPKGPSNWLVNLAALVVVLAGLRAASSVIVLILVAAFLSIVTAPAVFWLQRRRLPTWAAVSLVVTGMVGVFVIAGVLVGTSINAFLRVAPFYRARLDQQLRQIGEWLRSRGLDIAPTGWAEAIDTGQVITVLSNALAAIGGLLGDSILILLVVAFTLLEVSTFEGKLEAAFGTSSASAARFRQIARHVERYLALKTWISLATGAGVGIWVAALDLDFALLWALLAFLLNFIPNFGSILAAIPAVVLGLLQFGPGRALLVAAGYLLVNMVMGNIIEPRLMGRTMGLSTLVVMLSLLVWGWLFGPVGLFLAVPLTMALKIVLEEREETRWLAILMSSGAFPPARPPAANQEAPARPGTP